MSEMSSITGRCGNLGDLSLPDDSTLLVSTILLLAGGVGREASTLSLHLCSSTWTVGVMVSAGVLVFRGISPASSLKCGRPIGLLGVVSISGGSFCCVGCSFLIGENVGFIFSKIDVESAGSLIGLPLLM